MQSHLACAQVSSWHLGGSQANGFLSRPTPPCPALELGRAITFSSPSPARPRAEQERELEETRYRGPSFQPGGSQAAVPAPRTPQRQVRSRRASPSLPTGLGARRWGDGGERGDSSRIAAAVCPSFATCLREGEFQPEHPMPCDSVLCLSPVTVYFPPKVLGYWIL